MREICFAVIAFILMGLPVLPAAETQVTSKWATSPVKLDGVADEWLEDTLSLEKSVGVDYAFRNDGRNLYVLFVFKDQKALSSIEGTGMTLYFDNEGKKQKDFGVRFRKRNVTGQMLIAAMEKQGTPLSEARRLEILPKKMYVFYEAEAINKKGEVIPAAPSAAADPPAFHTVKQGTSTVYEFRIPLAPRNVHPAGVGSEPGKTVKVGFEWGGLTEEMRRRMSRAGGTGTEADASYIPMETSMGGGDENEGMRDRGEGPSPFAMRQRGPKKHSFWVDLKLAQS
jgi:hypothetical protein